MTPAPAAFKAAKTRKVEEVAAVSDQLYESCTTCHSHYRPGYGRRPPPRSSPQPFPGPPVQPGMVQDVRLALRTLARTPLFTGLAGGLLALGVGAVIAVFSVIDGVLLKALPYPEPDRIVTLWEATDRSRTIAVSAPNFQDWQESATSFSALAASTGGRSTVIGGREPVVTGVYARHAGVLCRARGRRRRSAGRSPRTRPARTARRRSS